MKQRPYHLLILTAFVLVLISFTFLKRDSNVDIHFHDTYIVLANTFLYWIFAAVALFIWLLYFLLNKILYSKTLTWTHVVITVLTVLPLALFLNGNFTNQLQMQYYDLNIWNESNGSSKLIFYLLLILLLSQCVLIVNLLAGLVKKLKNK